MKKKFLIGSSIGFTVLWTVSYFASHIVSAIVLFHNVKLWAFLVMLLVPGLGDIMAIFTLIKLKLWWPFILYGICIVFGVIGSIIASKADEG